VFQNLSYIGGFILLILVGPGKISIDEDPFSSMPETVSDLSKPMKLSADLADIVGKEAPEAECVKDPRFYRNLQGPRERAVLHPGQENGEDFGTEPMRPSETSKFLPAHYS
jgi:hypothetical protein